MPATRTTAHSSFKKGSLFKHESLSVHRRGCSCLGSGVETRLSGNEVFGHKASSLLSARGALLYSLGISVVRIILEEGFVSPSSWLVWASPLKRRTYPKRTRGSLSQSVSDRGFLVGIWHALTCHTEAVRGRFGSEIIFYRSQCRR